MHRTLSKFLVPVVLFCFPLLAEAGPGLSLLEISATPQNLAKVTAAIDKWMASPVGKQYKGQLLLQANVADGSNPATNSVVDIYHSLADFEAFGKLAQNDPAWAEFLNTVVPISTITSSSLVGVVKSWGDVNDTDMVWNVHYLTVKDPAGVMAALDAWMASPGGKKFPGQMYLLSMDAGGVSSPDVSGMVSVGFASMAEMETFNDGLDNDKDFATFIAAIEKASTHVGASIAQTVKVWGPGKLKALTKP
jgi:hypothetical protein